MEIIISNACGQPIYEQIYAQIKGCILAETLHEGDMLPSIRALAKDLRISVITTKRAYDELEKDGYIYTVAAKGCYVAPKDTELIREDHLRQIEQHIREILLLAAACKIPNAQVLELFDIISQEETNDERD